MFYTEFEMTPAEDLKLSSLESSQVGAGEGLHLLDWLTYLFNHGVSDMTWGPKYFFLEKV